MPTVLKSGSLKLLEPSGPVKVCNGIALPSYTHLQLCRALTHGMWLRVFEYNATRGIQTLVWAGNIIHAIQLKYKLSGRHETCPWLWHTQQIWPNTSSPVYCGQVARPTPQSFCPYTKPAPGSNSLSKHRCHKRWVGQWKFLALGLVLQRGKPNGNPAPGYKREPTSATSYLRLWTTPTPHPPSPLLQKYKCCS